MNPPRAISLLIPNLNLGGAEKVNALLAKEFSRREIKVKFLVFEKKGQLAQELESDFEIQTLVPVSQTFSYKAHSVWGKLLQIKEYLNRNEHHSVLVNMWPMTATALAAHKISKNRKPIVTVDHGVLSHSNLASSLIKREYLRLSLRSTYGLATHRVAVSKGVAEDLAKLSDMNSSEFQVIPNPVEVNSPTQSNLKNQRIEKWLEASVKLVACGSLKPVKNFSDLIEVMALLKKQTQAHLLLIGGGEERSNLEELAKEKGVSDSVTFLGHVPDPRAYFQKADVLALTSKHEGFGNVLVEAMSCGTPVVAYNCPWGPREILLNGKFGQLIPPSAIQEMAQAIIKESQQASVSSEALKKRAQDFSVEKAADAYLKLLEPGGNEGG